MSGLVSRNSILGKKALVVAGVIAGVVGLTLIACTIWPSRPTDVPFDAGDPATMVHRTPPRMDSTAALPPPSTTQAAYSQSQSGQEYHQSTVSRQDVTNQMTAEMEDSLPQPQKVATIGAEPLHEPYVQRHGGIGHVTFKPLQMEGQEAGIVDDLSHTIKPTTQAVLVLDQALDSSLPGPLVAHFDMDVRPWDNSWPPLIPKGTRVLGSYQPLDVGQRRMGGISAEAYLSDGRVIPLGGAPFTDDLGRMGIPGNLDTRFWERFGNAILVDAAFALIRLPGQALNSRQPGNTNINMDFGNSENVVSQVLNSTVNLKPIIAKNQGDKIGLLFVRPIRVPDIRLEIAR